MKFDGNSTLVCPACDETIHVGFGGEKNLVIHRTSKACKTKSQKKSKGSKNAKPNQDLHAFFKPRMLLNPPTITAPAPVHADEIKARTKDGMSCETSNITVSCNDPGETAREMGTPSLRPLASPNAAGKSPCQKGIELLDRLEAAAARIPASVPLATPDHRLSGFSADPRDCAASLEEDDIEDDWAALNPMLKESFGWGESEMQDNVKLMLNRGEYGLGGFIHFFRFFVLERGLGGAMIETKVDALLRELDNR
jgi:hypothetical protein